MAVVSGGAFAGVRFKKRCSRNWLVHAPVGVVAAAGSTITVTFTPPIFGPPISAMLLRINGQFSAPGFVNVWPSGTQPWTTDLFADTPDAPRSAAATAGVDNSTFRVYTSSAGSLNIDTNGYFTGSV